MDRDPPALQEDAALFLGASRVCGEAARLPFRDGAFDLVFSQCALMWMDLEATTGEIRRVLQPGGVLVAIEPDCGGMIEYPSEIATRRVWIEALLRAGADPLVGRKLPTMLDRLSLQVRTELLSELAPPSPLRFELLRTLSLTTAEERRLVEIESAAQGPTVVHLPFFLVTATNPV